MNGFKLLQRHSSSSEALIMAILEKFGKVRCMAFLIIQYTCIKWVQPWMESPLYWHGFVSVLMVHQLGHVALMVYDTNVLIVCALLCGTAGMSC
ncbi:unnamed protein product [Victoria cruziana]